jgi:uncharacterized protein (UPF0212 family)
VKEGWTTCGRCGESLDKLPMLSNPLRSKSLVINRKAVLHCGEKYPRVKTMKTCSLCGDMVRAGSEKCPRCGEPLEGALMLPSLWSRKEVVVDQKPMLP